MIPCVFNCSETLMSLATFLILLRCYALRTHYINCSQFFSVKMKHSGLRTFTLFCMSDGSTWNPVRYNDASHVILPALKIDCSNLARILHRSLTPVYSALIAVSFLNMKIMGLILFIPGCLGDGLKADLKR